MQEAKLLVEAFLARHSSQIHLLNRQPAQERLHHLLPDSGALKPGVDCDIQNSGIEHTVRRGPHRTDKPAIHPGKAAQITVGEGAFDLGRRALGERRAGVNIGQDGFGFALSSAGHLKVPQLGRVIIEADVEIGANTTIDRGAGPDTVVGAGTKIDNLVQIAHNVRIGKGCIIVSQVGISGSTEIGDFVMIGGQAGLTGHLQVGSRSKIAAQSGVMRNVDQGGTVGGSPAKPMREWLKEVAVVERLTKNKGR